ncbi:hypothetical protein [Pedobacter sp. UYP24]
MKRLFYLCAFIAFAFVACNGKNSDNKTAQSIDNSPPDTVRLDAVKKRDMIIILSILPDSLTKTFKWTKNQRIKMRKDLDSQKYYLDSAHYFSKLKKFENNQIEFGTAENSFSMTAYQIRDGHYVILAKDEIDGKQTINAYELYKNTCENMPLNEVIGKFNFMFLKDASSASCLGMFYEKNPIFDFDITDPSILIIKLKNYTKSDSKDCLKGDVLTLKFNARTYPFDFVRVKWSE